MVLISNTAIIAAAGHAWMQCWVLVIASAILKWPAPSTCACAVRQVNAHLECVHATWPDADAMHVLFVYVGNWQACPAYKVRTTAVRAQAVKRKSELRSFAYCVHSIFVYSLLSDVCCNTLTINAATALATTSRLAQIRSQDGPSRLLVSCTIHWI